MAEEVFESLLDESFLRPLTEPYPQIEDVATEITELDLLMDESFATIK